MGSGFFTGLPIAHDEAHLGREGYLASCGSTATPVRTHDITFPYDYSRGVLGSQLFFRHESVLLHAFLAYNNRFRILASLSMLHYSSPQALREYLPNYEPEHNDEGLGDGTRHFPSSTYLQVLA
jgi:hypothetical protein